MPFRFFSKASLVLLVVVAEACTYTLENKKYINPIQPPPSQINVVVDIESPNFKSPFYLDWPTTFSLKVQSLNKPVTGFTVLLDNTTSISASISDGIFQFLLHPAQVGYGTHSLKIQIKVDTQSGSLADQLGGEYYLVEKAFDLIVDPTLPPVATPLQPVIENGYLRIRWNLNSNSNHSYSYGLSKYNVTNYYTTAFVETKTFVGPGQMIYIDSGYVGGWTRYYLQVSNYFNSESFGSADTHTRTTEFLIQTTANQFKTLTWSSRISDANLTVVGPGGSQTVSLNSGRIDLDTVFLGDQKNYRVIINRNTHPLQAFDSTFSIGTQPNLAPFTDLRMLPQSKLLAYGQVSNDIIRYSLPDFVKEDALSSYFYSLGSSSTILLSVSADGQNSVFGSGGLPVEFNPLIFSHYSVYQTEIASPDNSSYINLIPSTLSTLSNNGLQGMSILYNGSPRPVIADMNVNTTQSPYAGVVWKDSVNQDIPVISEDGRYFCINTSDQTVGRVYQNISGTWSLMGQVPPGKKYFRGHSTTELIVVGMTVQVFDLSTSPDGNSYFRPVRTFNYSSGIGTQTPSVGYDGPSQNIVIETIDHYYYSTIRTYDVTTFALNGRAVAYAPPSAPYPIRHLYSGNYHFLTSGFAEKLQP